MSPRQMMSTTDEQQLSHGRGWRHLWEKNEPTERPLMHGGAPTAFILRCCSTALDHPARDCQHIPMWILHSSLVIILLWTRNNNLADCSGRHLPCRQQWYPSSM